MEIFIDNKYTKCYYRIVSNSLNRTLPDDVYSERHHIIPKCFYTKYNGFLEGRPHCKTNIVRVTAKEHYVLHLLLVKMLDNSHYIKKMKNALLQFKRTNGNGKRFTGVMYEQLRRSNIMKGENNPFYGLGHLVTGPNNHFYGKKHSVESRQLMSQIQKEKNMVGERNPFYGRHHTEEMKQKASELRMNIPKKCKRPYHLISPTNEHYIITEGIQIFCREHNLVPSNVINIAQKSTNGKKYTSRGWTIAYYENTEN
jgi:hypothetical protein